MKTGVVYKFKPHNKLNGTLFYCYEYYRFLVDLGVDVEFYIIDIDQANIRLVDEVFDQKYKNYNGFTPVRSVIDLYKLKLEKTLFLDVDSFYRCKEFCTGDIHCFSNELHDNYQYRDNRHVTFYGIYHYQIFDVECMLKLNFSIFKECKSEPGVFVSCLDPTHIKNNINRYKREFERPIILKKSHSGQGNLFDYIDHVHYVHVQRDTNNRIIPEAFYHGKSVSVEEVYNENDSIMMRYNDIIENGLSNYTLTEDDEMVKACLRSVN